MDFLQPNRNTNIAISFNDIESEWSRAFPNTMDVDSLYTWYPYHDEKAYAKIDDRETFKMGYTTTPKEVAYEYTKKELTIVPYEMASFKSEVEINEDKAGTITEVEDDLTKTVTSKLNQLVDLDFIDLLVDTTLWNNQAVTAVWTDQTNGDPEADLRDLRQDIHLQSGGAFSPNTIIASSSVLDKLFMNSKIKNRYDNVLGSQAEKQAYFLNLLGIKNLVEIKKCKNTAAKGDTAVYESVMGAFLWMGYLDPAPSRGRPTAMVPMVPKGYVKNDKGIYINTINRLGGAMFEDGRSGIKVVGRNFVAVKQVSKELGKLLTGIHS